MSLAELKERPPYAILRPKVTVMDLLLSYCPNGHLHIFGFWQQLRPEQKKFDLKEMKATILDECRDCGCEVASKYQLYWDYSGFVDGEGI